MFPRHFFFFAICVLALLAVVTVRAEEEQQESAEARNPLLAAAIRIIGKAFAKASAKCVQEAAETCKGDWKHPKNLVKCAGRFFKENKGRCALG